jgi:hypothetical protein
MMKPDPFRKARLIAAAPDLLAALKSAVGHCEGWRKFQDEHTRAAANLRSKSTRRGYRVPFPRILEDELRAAIAKAEGK